MDNDKKFGTLDQPRRKESFTFDTIDPRLETIICANIGYLRQTSLDNENKWINKNYDDLKYLFTIIKNHFGSLIDEVDFYSFMYKIHC